MSSFGDVSIDDALRQAFGDGRLTHAGFADQGRVILCAPRKHLHHAADLFIAADDRVQLSLAGHIGQVAPVFFQCLIGRFGILRGDALRAADGLEGVEDGVLRKPVRGEALALDRISQSEQQVLGGNIFVLHPLGITFRRTECLRGGGCKAHFDAGPLNLGVLVKSVLQFGAQGIHAAGDLGHERRDDALVLAQERQQQVSRLNGLMVQVAGNFLRLKDRFLGLLRVFFEIHPSLPLPIKSN